MSFEDALIRGIDNQAETQSRQRAHTKKTALLERAEKVIAESQIKPESFVDIYGEAVVRDDLAKAEELRIEHERNDSSDGKEHRRMATIFEAVFHEHVELSNWLGEDVLSYKASEYDDFINHVDSILEITKDGEELPSTAYVALGIDVTTGMNSLEKKFDRIFREIKEGEFAKVKYFESGENVSPKMRGELSGLSRLIIGADVATVRELSVLWENKDNRALGRHPIQYQIIDQMMLQLRAFLSFARSVGNEKAVKTYQSLLNFLDKVTNQKVLEVPDSGVRDQMMPQMKKMLDISISRALLRRRIPGR